VPLINLNIDLGAKERRKQKIEDEKRQAFTSLWNQAIQEANIPYLQSVEKIAKSEYGLEIEEGTKGALIGKSVLAGALEQMGGLGDIQARVEAGEKIPHPSEVVSRPGPGGEAEFFTGVPQTERTKAATAASVAGSLEATLTHKESSVQRRQRVAWEERTSTLGRKLFAQSLKDDEALQRQKSAVAMDFTLPPHEDQFDKAGNQIRYDYTYNEKQKKWVLDKNSGRTIRHAVTEQDKLAIKKEVVNMLKELQKVDSIDYNDAMKMMVVESLKKTRPKLAKEIERMETATAMGKLKFKQAIGMYIDDLIASGEFTPEEIEVLKVDADVPAPTPTAHYKIVDGKPVRQ
jgi:hypothetical protein